MSEIKEKSLDEIAAILDRPLNSDEIEWRTSFVRKSRNGDVWVRLLPYKTTRIDKQRLDEALGKFNWTSKYFRDGAGSLFCEISVKLGSEWITRQDCGEGESPKAEATDAFKRACLQFGIGSSLYSIPQVWIKLIEGEYYLDNNGEVKVAPKFHPERWNWIIENEFIRAYDKDTLRFDSERYALARAV